MVRRLTPSATLGLVSLLSLVMFSASLAAAQNPTGTISGRVVDGDGLAVRGATVTIESSALQGPQETRTTDNGAYVFHLLPPGVYEVVIDTPRFAPVLRTQQVSATEPVTLDVTLSPAAVTENVDVVAESGPFAGTVEQAATIQDDLLDQLPTNRTASEALALVPGVHTTGPDGAITVAGSMTYDNVYQVNGVQVQDNVRGNLLGLYIPDAVNETTVTTGGVSAEYGRFTGGVINVVTKSGGNQFGGSFRTSFTNDSWRTTTPMNEPKVDQTVPTYEYTVGGYVLPDQLWFFGAGRTSDRTVARQTGYTDVPYEYRNEEQRTEFKLTYGFSSTHRLSGAYTGVRETEHNSAYPSPAEIMDLDSLTTRDLPQDLMALNYTGTFGSSFFVEAQYSSRSFSFEGDGGLFTDRVRGTTLMDQTTGAYYWSPNFCGVCAPEERDNTDIVVKGTYFLSNGTGSHLLTFGYDGFNDRTLADNHQSASDFHVWTSGTTVQDGMIYPVIDPGLSTWIISWPLAENSQGTNFRTHSVFLNDRWALNDRWSFNLGVRFDKHAGKDASGTLVADDSMVSPRVGVAYDVTGDGRTIVTGSAGRYVAGLSNGIASQGSRAGLPGIYAYFYEGQPINTGDGPLVPTADAIGMVFDWYDQAQPPPFFVDVPGLASQIGPGLRSPHADEFAIGITRNIGNRGLVRADYVRRSFGNFYANRIDRSTGLVFDELQQPYDLKLIENTNALEREYEGLDIQGTYRIGTDVSIGGSYTLSHLAGNVNGETGSSGPVAANILSYPEYFQESWRYPVGDLSADQRHRARIWGTYILPYRSPGRMSIGLIQQLESGTPYGAAGAALVAPFVDNPGYALAPETTSYFFTPRDAFRTEAMARTDLAFTFSRTLDPRRQAEVFAQFQLLNAFNQFQAFNATSGAINTTVLTAIDDPDRFEFFDPFTEMPVQGVHWDMGEEFGEPVSRGAFTQPRTFRFSVGFRF